VKIRIRFVESLSNTPSAVLSDGGEILINWQELRGQSANHAIELLISPESREQTLFFSVRERGNYVFDTGLSPENLVKEFDSFASSISIYFRAPVRLLLEQANFSLQFWMTERTAEYNNPVYSGCY